MGKLRYGYYYLYALKDSKEEFINIITAVDMADAHEHALKFIPDDRYHKGDYILRDKPYPSLCNSLKFTLL